jgi:hypothetical protein
VPRPGPQPGSAPQPAPRPAVRPPVAPARPPAAGAAPLAAPRAGQPSPPRPARAAPAPAAAPRPVPPASAPPAAPAGAAPAPPAAPAPAPQPAQRKVQVDLEDGPKNEPVLASELAPEAGDDGEDPTRGLTDRELAILDSLDRLAGGAHAEPDVVKPTQAMAAMIRLLIRKRIVTEAEFLDELSKK